MILSNTDFNVLYVDPSASGGGDGSSPASALNSLPERAADIPDRTCYLIRRTAAGTRVRLPQGENASLTALAVVGMPMPDDEFHGFMPDAARDAWDGDSAEYAEVLAETSDEPWGDEGKGMSLPACQTFFLYRIHLFRDGQDAYEAAVKLPNSAGTASVSVGRCRFGLAGADLDSETYTAVPAHGAAMYLECDSPQVFSLRHCTVHVIPSGWYEAASWAFYARSPAFLDVGDVDVWSVTAEYGGDMGPGATDPALKFGYSSQYSSSAYCGNSNCENIRFHYLRRNATGWLPMLLGLCCGDFACVRNITAGMEGRQLGSGTPSVVAPSGLLVSCVNAEEYVYENITVSLPQVWRVPQGCGILRLTGSGASQLPGCCKLVRNITVSLGDDLGVDTERNGNYYQDFKSPDNCESRSAVQMNFSYYSDYGYGCGHEPVVVRNVDVVHPRGIALYVCGAFLKDCRLKGMLRASNATCDIEGVESWYPGYAVWAGYGSTVRIGSLVLGNGNIAGTDADPAILGSPQENSSCIYVETSNRQLMGDTRSTSTTCDNCYAVACGSERDDGHYTMRTVNGMCNTWGVARSGGTVPASLKLSNNAADGKGYLSLGRQPFGGFRIPAQAGRGVFRMHVALKGLADTDQLARRLLVQLSVPRPDGSEEVLFSNASGRWVGDDSQWIGESSLSAYRLEIPVDVPEECDVDVKIHFKWYSAAGYAYVDPGMSIS